VSGYKRLNVAGDPTTTIAVAVVGYLIGRCLAADGLPPAIGGRRRIVERMGIMKNESGGRCWAGSGTGPNPLIRANFMIFKG
jgi:hypothetical protein